MWASTKVPWQRNLIARMGKHTSDLQFSGGFAFCESETSDPSYIHLSAPKSTQLDIHACGDSLHLYLEDRMMSSCQNQTVHK